MYIYTTQQQGRVPITIFRVEGFVNINNADSLREAASQAHANGSRYVLIDLTDVPAMTSDGLRALHYIYLLFDNDDQSSAPSSPNAGMQLSAHLKLLNPSSHVRQLLETAGFSDVIELHNDWQAA
ncbi:MAG TPA: STAS domain-containing protein, partial [Roseiflexaceae bacterium]|nr:STAS domain-containing protein [Roseiflexaceae bacterium]